MGELLSFEEIWREHVRDNMFARDYDDTLGQQFIKYYRELDPELRAKFRDGLARVVAQQSRGWQSAQGYLESIREIDVDQGG